MKTFLWIFMLAIVLTGSISWAANIYVDNKLSTDITNGTYSIARRDNSGSDGKAYKTISGAIAAMSGGDDLYLRGGTYHEHDLNLTGLSGSVINYTSIQSYSGEWAIVDGQRSCTTANARAVFIVPSNGSYFRFERLEITGGGYTSCSIQCEGAAGIRLGTGANHIIIRYNYIHDNLAYDCTNNPAGVSAAQAPGPNNITIEYNKFYNNGASSPGSATGNCSNITFFADYGVGQTDRTHFDVSKASYQNIVRYNYIDANSQGEGVKYKSYQALGADSPPASTYQEYGDKWHHNIVINPKSIALEASQDFIQIYNNLIDYGSGVALDNDGSIGISTSKPYSVIHTYHGSVYNNTIIASREAGICLAGQGGKTSYHPYHIVYNNIIRAQFHGSWNQFVPIDIAIGPRTATERANVTMTDCHVERNYIYETHCTDVFGVGEFMSNYANDGRTLAEFNSDYSVTNYQSAVPGMFLGTSGTNRYKLNSGWSDYNTVATGGIGGSHPYLPGVTIPSYIGATGPKDSGDGWNPNNPDPDDAGWVDYVMKVVGGLSAGGPAGPAAPKNLRIE